MMYINRTNQNQLFSAFESSFITAILGPRQVGKSTLVAHYKHLHPHYLWVELTMDSLLDRDRIDQGQLLSLIEEKAEQRLGKEPIIWVAIDEAQKCPALFDQIKIIYDRFKQQHAIKFILTGSASLSLHQLSAESLAGRIQLFYLHEFNLRESASLQQSKPLPTLSTLEWIYHHHPTSTLPDVIAELAPFRSRLLAALNTQLVWGGLPELFSIPEETQRINYLGNYLHTYLEKDVRAIETISDLHLYRKLIGILAEQTGSVRQDLRIREALGCHAETLKKYRGFLEATLFYTEVYPYVGSTLKRLIKSPKGYLVNNGLISLITGIRDYNTLQQSGMIGHRLENWFLKELQIWLARSTQFGQIDFWRTANHVEVDFVVSIPPHVFPFEVTHSSQVNNQKIKHLQSFLAEEPKAKIGYYIYNGDYRYDAERRICFLPAWSIG